jgi:uncharacterized membrane protein
MNVRPLLVANGILIAAMTGVSAWVWQTIPDGARLPVHWGIDGQPDRFGSKVEALVALPVIAVLLTLLFVGLPYIDPRRRNLDASSKLWNAAAIGGVALLAYVHMLMVLSATGRAIDMGDYLIPAISILFIVIGNYLPKTRSNWFAGVRTPWSMSSEYSWTKTHRLASRLFMGSGILSIAVWLIAGTKIAMFVFAGTILATAVISIVASYVYWKNDPARVGATANGEA